MSKIPNSFFSISGDIKKKELNFLGRMFVHFYIIFLQEELVYFASFTDWIPNVKEKFEISP